jgi:hypothetical protein
MKIGKKKNQEPEVVFRLSKKRFDELVKAVNNLHGVDHLHLNKDSIELQFFSDDTIHYTCDFIVFESGELEV